MDEPGGGEWAQASRSAEPLALLAWLDPKDSLLDLSEKE
jgi:hypothetical protein